MRLIFKSPHSFEFSPFEPSKMARRELESDKILRLPFAEDSDNDFDSGSSAD